jgi:dienelactone hydrolase
VTSILVPSLACEASQRAAYVQHTRGRPQLFSWDRDSGEHRRLTDAPQGVELYEIEPDGEHVWWFESSPDGTGYWWRERFDGGGQTPGLAGLPPGRPYGIAFAGIEAVVTVGVEGMSRTYLGVAGREGRLVHAAEGYLSLADLSPDGQLFALAGAPGSDRATQLVAVSDSQPGITLSGSRDCRIWPLEFRPGAAEAELLLVIERNGEYRTATWSRPTGLIEHDWIAFDTEITADWYGRTGQILLRHDRAGRGRLLVLEPSARTFTVLPIRPGTLHDLALGQDGTIYGAWSSDGVPPGPFVLRPEDLTHTSYGEKALVPPRPPRPAGAPGHRRHELWTEQPYGAIHSFVATPPGDGPWPTLFLIHGGPSSHDRDSFDGRTEFFLDAGYAVVRTNYRGSTGYGAGWRQAANGSVGLAQIEDLAAVRRELLANGVSHPDQVGLCGHSWGGYLVLLALGVQPELWAVGLAGAPIADYPEVYAATTPALRELDRELFGGAPDEVPERYRAASPASYVEQVTSPLLITASRYDEKCPPAQLESYVRRLAARGIQHELHWLGSGHHSLDLADHASTFSAMDRFARGAFGLGANPPATASMPVPAAHPQAALSAN